MPRIVWDKIGDRTYESGLDRGVLYLAGGDAVPWNGLTSVVEKSERSTSLTFYDGIKISETISLGSFAATVSAITYPDALDEIEGKAQIRSGVFLGEQEPETFGLCYRTRIGNDVDGDEAGYKIHVVYNVSATPSDRTYETASDDPSLVDFEWDLTTTPVELDGFRGAAHITFKTADIDPDLLEEIEKILYGSGAASASLIPMDELISYINSWFRLQIIDNGDGTWEARTSYDGYIYLLDDDEFRIDKANAIYINDHTYILSDTKDLEDTAAIKIIDNGDGTWTATTSYDGLIIITGDTFEIRNATIEMIDANTYILSDTPE